MISKVKIGSIWYKLLYVPNLKKENGEKLDGNISHTRPLIQIDGNLEKQMEHQTLLHEVLHSMLVQIGDNKIKEPTIDCLAYQLYGFIHENPKLISNIVEGK